MSADDIKQRFVVLDGDIEKISEEIKAKEKHSLEESDEKKEGKLRDSIAKLEERLTKKEAERAQLTERLTAPPQGVCLCEQGQERAC